MKKTSIALLAIMTITTLTAPIASACGPGGCPLSRRIRQNSTSQQRTANWKPTRPSFTRPAYSQPAYTNPIYTRPTYTQPAEPQPTVYTNYPPSSSRVENYTPQHQNTPSVTSPAVYTSVAATPAPASQVIYSPSPAPIQSTPVHQVQPATQHKFSPVYETQPIEQPIVQIAKATPPEPKVIYQTIVKKQPAKKKPSIHLECNGESDEQCDFTLINPDGKEAKRTLASGEQQVYPSSEPWKIMFRQAKGKPWVGFVVKPGHSYSLEKDENDLWSLFEVS